MAESIALTFAEAGAAVGVSDRTIRRAVEAGDLPVRYIGRRPVVLVDDLKAWVENAPSERSA